MDDVLFQYNLSSSQIGFIFLLLSLCYSICSPLIGYMADRMVRTALGQDGRHSADDILRLTFLYESHCALINISLKFLPMGPIDNMPALLIQTFVSNPMMT